MKTKSTLFCLVFAFCANATITVYAQAVNKQDSLALVDLFNSTDGPNWVHHTNWLTKKPVRTWYGILTITDTRVTSLSLDNNNLNGTIPSSLGNLVNLTSLDLGFNELRGTIPSSIGKLANLFNLVLFFNKLSGSIPSSIGNLVNLGILYLNDNRLSGSIPSSIGNLVNLFDLALSNNKLTGSIPSSIGNLVNLTELLLLNNNQLSGSIPSSIGNLNISRLDLSNNQLSDSIPSSITNLSNLYYLDLSNNQLSGSIPSAIGNLVNLGFLNLSNNQLSDTIPSSIGNLHPGGLYLSNNQLSGSIPSSIGNLVNLGTLDLSNNHLSGNIPTSFGNFEIIDYLNLSHNKLSGEIPAAIANIPFLSALDLSSNNLTFNGMESIAQKFPFAMYEHQALIPIHQNGDALSVSAGGTLMNNTYKWIRITKTGKTLVASIPGDSVFHPSQKGIYLVRVTNSVATGLTLRSDTIHYTTRKEIAEAASPSSENATQQYIKTNLFFVYPNPAKNILHIQTSGKAILSLTDQSGKILFTKSINGRDEINVSNFAAGLYYLRNTSSGVTKKVIITK